MYMSHLFLLNRTVRFDLWFLFYQSKQTEEVNKEGVCRWYAVWECLHGRVEKGGLGGAVYSFGVGVGLCWLTFFCRIILVIFVPITMSVVVLTWSKKHIRCWEVKKLQVVILSKILKLCGINLFRWRSLLIVGLIYSVEGGLGLSNLG